MLCTRADTHMLQRTHTPTHQPTVTLCIFIHPHKTRVCSQSRAIASSHSHKHLCDLINLDSHVHSTQALWILQAQSHKADRQQHVHTGCCKCVGHTYKSPNHNRTHLGTGAPIYILLPQDPVHLGYKEFDFFYTEVIETSEVQRNVE